MSGAVISGGRLHLNAELNIWYTQRNQQLLDVADDCFCCLLSGFGKLCSFLFHALAGALGLFGELLYVKLV